MDKELSEENEKAIREAGATLAVASAGIIAGGIAGMVLSKLLTTNCERKDLTGNTSWSPTEKSTTASENKAAGASTEASGAKDNVKGQGGTVAGSQTDAEANSNEAMASQNDAKALNTSAGATEIATKALKMN